MSSPITSVPEPGQSGSDALASVITQVQPGRVPTGASRGPARPTKVAKAKATTADSGAAKKKKKKKGKKGASEAAAAEQEEGTADGHAEQGEEGDVGAPETSAEAGIEGGQAEGTASSEAASPGADEGSHTNEPSSTLVSGSTTRGGSTIGASTGDIKALDEATAAEAVAKEDGIVSPVPEAEAAKGDGDDKDKLAPVVLSPGGGATASLPATAAATAPSAAAPSAAVKDATTSTAAPPKASTSTVATATPARVAAAAAAGPTSASSSKGKATATKKGSSGGPLAKLVALLTCSSGARKIVAEDLANEKAANGSATASGKQGKAGSAQANGGKAAADAQGRSGAAGSAATGNAAAQASSTNDKKQKQKKKMGGLASKRQKAAATGAAAGVAAGAAGAATLAAGTNTPGASRGPSRKGSFVNAEGGVAPSTPGGGTRLPREETGDVMSGAVQPPGSSFIVAGAPATPVTAGAADSEAASGDDDEDDEDDDDDDEDDEDDEDDDETDMGVYMDEDEESNEEQRLIMQGGMGIPTDEHGNPRPLLDEIIQEDAGRKCLVLDLDETLVHSSFKMIQNADFIVPVEIEGTVHSVYVIKRPGVDEFMRRMGELYEVVVFTASLSKYADPVLDILDIHRVVRHRLFRESCYNHKGNYVKDLSQLGRPIGDTIIIDNSPASYIFHPNNAVPISSWFNDPHDTELTDLCPFLADLSDVDDVRAVLDGGL